MTPRILARLADIGLLTAWLAVATVASLPGALSRLLGRLGRGRAIVREEVECTLPCATCGRTVAAHSPAEVAACFRAGFAEEDARRDAEMVRATGAARLAARGEA